MAEKGGKVVVAILTDDSRYDIGAALHKVLISRGIPSDYVSLKDVRVNPCYNCGGCTHQSYGKCINRDDGDWIYGKVLRAESLVVVTPIVFGGYSVKTKRVLDKFGLLMDSHYFISNGEMTKGGMPGRVFRYFALGVQQSGDVAEAEAFKTLVKETILITRGAGNAYVAGPTAADWALNQIAGEVAGT
jgi:multimeric flavodoxin WrbA